MRPVIAIAAAVGSALACLYPARLAAAPTGSITLDGSLGTSGALTGPNFQITAGMGRLNGNNLFQSFGVFNLVAGESATFSGPANVQNILARVTGGTPSSIDGSINSSIVGANLFFLNPAGVMFGPNAQINVTGSFIVGTPDYVKLADGGMFFTSLGGNDNLTSAPVSAFGFLSAHPASVTAANAILSVNPFQGFHIIAGDVTLDGTEVDAPSGNLSIFSAASAGEVPFSLATAGSGYANATNTAFGNVTLKNGAYADIDGIGGGKVVIRGGKLVVDNATISSFNGGSAPGGPISIQASQITLQNAGEIISTAIGAGNGGDILIRTNSLTVDGTTAPAGFQTAIVAQANAPGAGNININATGAVVIVDGGEILSTTAAPGGNITIDADSLDLDGSGTSAEPTGISVDSIGSTPGASGLIVIDTAEETSITSGADVASFGTGAADALGISVHAGTLDLDALASPFGTGIESVISGAGGAGPITVNVDGVLTAGTSSIVESDTFGDQAAADITVHAGSLSLTRGTIGSFSESTNGVLNLGDTGSVSVIADQSILIQTGGLVGIGTNSAGNAGSVNVQAPSMTIDGTGGAGFFTGISNQSTGGTGNAGPVTVNVSGALSIVNNGDISSNTFSAGHGGDVLVNAGSLNVVGDVALGVTGISSNPNSGSTGDGGSLTVNVLGDATLTDGGEISITVFSSGNGGVLDVNVNGALSLTNGGEVSAGTGAAGGKRRGQCSRRLALHLWGRECTVRHGYFQSIQQQCLG